MSTSRPCEFCGDEAPSYGIFLFKWARLTQTDRLSGGRKKMSQQIQKWHMKGDFFDSCSCEVSCPCNWQSPPTGNHCIGAIAIHVKDGKYGDTKLDDLSIVLVVDF